MWNDIIYHFILSMFPPDLGPRLGGPSFALSPIKAEVHMEAIAIIDMSRKSAADPQPANIEKPKQPVVLSPP